MQDIHDEFVIKASKGDVESFEKIYRTYTDYVYNVALRIVQNREDAQEVTQEVFISVYRNLKNFRFQAKLKTWIYRITVNKAINHTKKESKMKDKTVDYIDASGAENPLDSLDARAEREHKEGMINKLLDALTPEQRACIVLRNIEGLSYKEIAKVLNIGINAVRSRLKRAREKVLALKKEVMTNEL
ncbi:MAG: sigma-70 family RNA polymerase sigma factor [Pseudomonadota bacterium]